MCIRDRYTPNLSDPIKNQFHTDALNEKKGAFLKAWLQIGWRNKKTYIEMCIRDRYYGLRGVGKTVLLNAIEEKAEDVYKRQDCG